MNYELLKEYKERFKKHTTMNGKANEFLKIMNENGIVVQTYSAKTTRSLYLKLDFGLLYSVRFSDHRGKKKYNYRYNVFHNVKEYQSMTEKDKRFYLSTFNLHFLCLRIIEHRTNIIRKYGIESYNNMKKNDYESRKDSKGFWQNNRTFLPKVISK